jgi:UDP:flavonoid glycosyltransferase YjiC (YdhE family)
MARIVFAWELGGDYGHLSRLLPVAQELARRGHETVFVVRELLGAEALLAPHGIRWFQAPLWIAGVTNLPPPISYPELLMQFGYLDARALTGVCKAWLNLFDLLQPGLLVLDHAPTALLASRGRGVPRVNFGDGFCIPPAARPIPPFRWWERVERIRLEDSEQRAWQNANAVMFALQGPPMGSFSELLGCDAELMCAFPELDHYRERSPVQYLGPIFSLGQGEPARWSDGEGPQVFAYLKSGYAHLERVLQALHGSPARVLAHVPGIARRMVKRYTSARMAFSDLPVDMPQASAGCDVAVCHGGAGTTAAMLLAGRPLVLLPMQTEQTMGARRVAELGAGVVVLPDAAGQFPKVLKAALANAALREGATRFARAHAGYDQMATVRTAADMCERLLGARS